MALGRARFRGKVNIRGRPREQAQAEIMIMKQREAYERRKRKRLFFTIIDFIAILSLLGGIYSIFVGRYVNGILLILIGLLILGYFVLRKQIGKAK